jgi:phosphatidylinositol glycan class B
MKSLDYRVKIALTAGVIYVIAAIFNSSILSADEHYQIIEFASYKIGITPVQLLPWEFAKQMRPFLQPGLFYLCFKFFTSLGIADPFLQVTLLRLFTSVAAIAILFLFCTFLERTRILDVPGKFIWFTIYFIFFAPLFYTRLSSETYSCLSFILGLSLWGLRGNYLTHLLGFLFLSLSFTFRYQSAFLLAGFFLWLWWIHHSKAKELISFLLIFLITQILATLIDSWGYGTWTFAPFNYFKENILHGKASEFGTSPFWYYFVLLAKDLVFPFGIFLPMAAIVFFIGKRKNLISWISFPFFIIHCFVAHKETRFLYPLAPFATAMTFPLLVRMNRKYLLFVSFVNAIALIGVLFSSNQKETVFRHWIWKHQNEYSALVFEGESPFYVGHGLPSGFYPPQHLKEISYAPTESPETFLNSQLQNSPKEKVLFYRSNYGAPVDFAFLKDHCKPLLINSYYPWINSENRDTSWAKAFLKRNRYFELFECGLHSTTSKD